jgi:hypothetical protein
MQVSKKHQHRKKAKSTKKVWLPAVEPKKPKAKVNLDLPNGTHYTMPLKVMFAKLGHPAIHHLLSAADLIEKEADFIDILRWKATTS